MDFIITHFPIDNNIFSEEEKISLMTSALKLLIKNEHSATRRLLIWLMGQNQDDMKQTISDAHIHTFDKIVISKTDVVGGQ